MWRDVKFGTAFRILSKIFFGGSFAYDYIANSKIRNEYK